MSDQGGATPEVRFGIQRIYVKDVSFESPGAPQIFAQAWKPRIHLDLNSRTQRAAPDVWEVVLTLALTASVSDEQTGYIVEIQQAGLFQVAGLDGERLEQVLSITCPTVLFPYARESLDALIIKGGFAPLMLAPVNFEAIWMQAKQKQAAAAAAPAAPDAPPAADGDVRH